MSEPRLKARFWVQATLRQAQNRGSNGAVVRRGDDDAGSILVLLRSRQDRITLLTQTRTADGAPAWIQVADAVDPPTASATVERAISRDPDLWVVEFDSEDGRPPFEATLLPTRHGD